MMMLSKKGSVLFLTISIVSGQTSSTNVEVFKNFSSRNLLSVLPYERGAASLSVSQVVDESSGRKWNNHNNTNRKHLVKKKQLDHAISQRQVLLFVHIAKTGGSSFDEILKKGVNGQPADCIVEKKHYEDKSIPLDKRYDFPSCNVISTEFSRHAVSKFLLPRTREGSSISNWSPASLSHVKFFSLMREPFSRLLSQYRHDRYYTPRRFRECKDLIALVTHGSNCIESGESAYRYQNFQTMMLGGCTWNHKVGTCESAKLPVAKGGGYVKPMDILAEFSFVGVNEHFEGSVCVFYDAIGDHHNFKKFCGSSSNRATPRMMQGSWIANKKGGETTSLDAATLRASVPTNELDFKLYWAAYDKFIEKAKVLESKTGFVII